MVAQLAARVTQKQVQIGRIPEEQAAVYQYGYEALINYALNLVMIAIIATLLQSWQVATIFVLSYVPLRSYAGGYHASTHERCTVASGIMVVLFCLFFKWFPLTYAPVCSVIWCIAGAVVIWSITPVEDRNRPLTPGEVKVFGKRCRMVWLAELAVMICFALAGHWKITAIISLSQAALAFMLVSGWLKNWRADRKNAAM